MIADLTEIQAFLPCATPKAWIDYALAHQDILLIDHAQCEKKAASSALSLIYRYPTHHDMLLRMSKIAREELRHFEQVLKIMNRRGIAYQHLAPSRYAGELRKICALPEPAKLIDTLIIGAFIEARSCERFAAIAPLLDSELCDFYQGLLASEARHYQVYLRMAQSLSDEPLEERIKAFAVHEAALIQSPDDCFRFHSGLPTS